MRDEDMSSETSTRQKGLNIPSRNRNPEQCSGAAGHHLEEDPGSSPSREHPAGDCHMRVLIALRRIMHSVDTYSKKLSVDYHITVPQLICLHAIVRDGPITLSSLGKLVSLSMSTVNGIIDRLEAKKLVERKRTDPDRRKVLVSATDAGVMLSRNMPPLLQNRLVQAISELPELEQVSIALSLERIVDMMEENQHPDSSRR